MRKFYLTTFLMANIFVMNAQTQIGNGDFEAWENAGTSNEEPTNWNGFKTANCTLGALACGFAQNQQVKQSTQVRPGSTGTRSASIYSVSVFGVTVANGTLTCGRVNIGSTTTTDPSNHNFTTLNDPLFSEAFTSKPDSVVFWANFKPVSGSNNDKARVSAIVHTNLAFKDPNDVATADNLGQADSNFVQTNGWKRMSVPFQWTGNASSAAYILVTFSTNVIPGSGTANDTLWIDDLSLIYNTPSGVNELSANNQIIYPNPAHNYFVVEHFDEANTIVKLTDALGHEISLQQNGNKFHFNNVVKGIYFVQIYNNNKRECIKINIE